MPCTPIFGWIDLEKGKRGRKEKVRDSEKYVINDGLELKIDEKKK